MPQHDVPANKGYLGDKMWTVHITIRVWPDQENTSPIEHEIEQALRPILGREESMTIDIVEPTT